MRSRVAIRPFSLSLLAAELALQIALPSPARAATGTHFVAEVQTGFGFPSHDDYGALGYALQGGVGAGFRWPQLPLRIYLIASASWTRFAVERESTYHHSALTQDVLVVALGLRGLVPVYRGLRVFADFSGGYRRTWAALDQDSLERYEQVEDQFVPIFGFGIQYRLLRALSVGLRNEWQFLAAPERPDIPALASGLREVGERRWQSNLLATVSVHF